MMTSSTTTDRDPLDPRVLAQLGNLELVGRLIADSLRQGARRTRKLGFSTEFSDFKVYCPGDDLRFLDWRVYARTDRLLVRRFEAETSFESMLVLDASQSMAWRWRDAISKLEYATCLFAALAHVHTQNQDLIGFLCEDARELHYLAPRSQARQLRAILERLAALAPSDSNRLRSTLEALAGLKRHRGQIVLCSDLLDAPEEVDATFDLLANGRDDGVVIHLLDRAEIDLPFDDHTHLVDSESGEELAVDFDALKREHPRRIEEFRRRCREGCEQRGLRYYPLDTGVGFLDALLQMVVD